MSEMVEKVARALVVARFGKDGLCIFDPIPAGFPGRHEAEAKFKKRVDEAMTDARAAIEAMREPTDEMCFAAQSFMEKEIGSSATLQGCAYMAAIDAALKD